MTNDEMIKLLIPDLPTAPEIAPWLLSIDQRRWYINFGPLVHESEAMGRAVWQ